MKKFVFLCLLLLVLSSKAYAHKVNVFAYVEGDTVYTESYFSGGKKVNDGLIEVYDTEGHKLLEGKTNKEGQFNFEIPKKGDLKIILNASLGHRDTYDLSAKAKPKRVSLRDVIAGIGYIFGITGILMFFLSRKRKNASA